MGRQQVECLKFLKHGLDLVAVGHVTGQDIAQFLAYFGLGERLAKQLQRLAVAAFERDDPVVEFFGGGFLEVRQHVDQPKHGGNRLMCFPEALFEVSNSLFDVLLAHFLVHFWAVIFVGDGTGQHFGLARACRIN